MFKLICSTILLGLLISCSQSPLSVSNSTYGKATASTFLAPSISCFTGSIWWSHCGPWNQYYQIPFESASGMTFSSIPIKVYGKNLSSIYDVTISAQNYKVSILLSKRTDTSLTLDIRALSNGWYMSSPTPVPFGTPKKCTDPAQSGIGLDPMKDTQSNAVLTFWYKLNGSPWFISKTLDRGIIPVIEKDQSAYGQCTYFAKLQRLHYGLTIPHYSTAIRPSGDPSNKGFPVAHSVFCCVSSKYTHMAFINSYTTTIKTLSPTTASVTYNYSGSQYNAGCDGILSPFNTSMAVQRTLVNGKYVYSTPAEGILKVTSSLIVTGVVQ